MNPPKDSYLDLKGRVWALSTLDAEERALLKEIRKYLATRPAWHEFQNYCSAKIAALYDGRGTPRKQASRGVLFQVTQDMGSRLGIAQGIMRESTYRDQLERIINDRFKSRREFCEATGISEDMLSHVLAGRKHLAIDTLTEALKKIGYTIRLVPNQPAAPPKSKSKSRAS